MDAGTPNAGCLLSIRHQGRKCFQSKADEGGNRTAEIRFAKESLRFTETTPTSVGSAITMPTTQLFVELLVIGVGVALWLLLVVGAVFGLVLSPRTFSLSTAELLPLVAMTYVLGILMDRIAREVMGKFLSVPKPFDVIPIADAERLICEKSERLWSTCTYNRSRLRICRAWSANFALLALAYAAWNIRVAVHTFPESIAVVFIAACGSWLACRVTKQLHRDYYAEVAGHYRMLKPGTAGPGEGGEAGR
jgi:hypothetical protein